MPSMQSGQTVSGSQSTPDYSKKQIPVQETPETGGRPPDTLPGFHVLLFFK